MKSREVTTGNGQSPVGPLMGSIRGGPFDAVNGGWLLFLLFVVFSLVKVLFVQERET